MFYDHEDLSDMLTERAVRWIDEYDSDRRFFLCLAHRNVHGPMIPAERFGGASEIEARGYFIAEMDWSTGQVIDALKRKGVFENTLFILTSDNGGVFKYQPTNDYPVGHGHRINGPLRGQKNAVYEGGHRVPFIARWPTKVQAATTNDDLIALTDLLATFSDYFSVDLPGDAGEGSFSVLTALLDMPSQRPKRNELVNDSFTGLFSSRRGPWKLILGHGGGGAGESAVGDEAMPTLQRYDLSKDFAEEKYLAGKHPDKVVQLVSLLEQIRRTGGSHGW